MTAPTDGAVTSPRDDELTQSVAAAWIAAGEECRVVLPETIWANYERELDDLIDRVVVVPRLKHAECVLTGEENLGPARERLAGLLEQGWRVSALLPLGRLGSGHDAFRGLSIKMQGWWQTQPDRQIRFSAPEVP